MPDEHPEASVSPELATHKDFFRRSRAVRQMILDYALGSAIVGLNPFPGTLTLTLLVTGLLVFKMMRDIAAKWGYPKGQDALAIAGNVFGGIGAFAIAFMAWVTIFCLGLMVPIFRAWDISAALFTFTWAVGQVTHHFYASGRFRGEER